MDSGSQAFEDRVQAVNDALNRGDIRSAHARVIGDAWAEGLKADETGAGEDATYRVACATVLFDWKSFRQVRERYPTICDPESERLKKLLEVADRWWVLRKLGEFPRPFIDFAVLVPISFREKQVEVARELAAWYWAEPDAAIGLFRRIDKSSVDIVPFVVDLAQSFDGDVKAGTGTLPLGDRRSPSRVLLPLLLPMLILAVAALLGGAWFMPADSALTLREAARHLVAGPLLVLFVGTGLFALLFGLQRKYLDACLAADVAPGTDAPLGWMNPVLQYMLQRNGPLRLGYWLGRLGRLDPASSGRSD